MTFDTDSEPLVTRKCPSEEHQIFPTKMSERREEEGEERETNNHHASSMSTEEALQIRDSTKDLMQLSITEREQRVDASVNLAFKDTIFTSLSAGYSGQELVSMVKAIERTPMSFVITRDGTQLGYHCRTSLVEPAKAIYIIFGLNNATLAKTSFFLTKSFPVDVYAAFPRGYGSSSGKRGYAKHRDDYFSDMADIIEHVRRNANPGLPIIIGGYILSSPMVTQFLQSKYYVPVDGLAYCGLFHRDAARYGLRKAYRSFRTKTHPFKIFLASITGGRIYGRSVVGQASVNDDLYLLLPGITSTFYGNMVSIMLSRHADQIILKSGLPFYALYAKQNELIDEKSARIFDKVLAKDPRSKIEYIDGGLTTLSSTGLTNIGRWIIETFVEGKPEVHARPSEYKFMKALDGHWLQYRCICETKQPHCSVIYYGSASIIDEERTASSTFLDQMMTSPKDKAFIMQFAAETELLHDPHLVPPAASGGPQRDRHSRHRQYRLLG